MDLAKPALEEKISRMEGQIARMEEQIARMYAVLTDYARSIVEARLGAAPPVYSPPPPVTRSREGASSAPANILSPEQQGDFAEILQHTGGQLLEGSRSRLLDAISNLSRGELLKLANQVKEIYGS